MSNTFGIGFAVGAALSPTVSNIFRTVEQKIKYNSQRRKRCLQDPRLWRGQTHYARRSRERSVFMLRAAGMILCCVKHSIIRLRHIKRLRRQHKNTALPWLAMGAPMPRTTRSWRGRKTACSHCQKPRPLQIIGKIRPRACVLHNPAEIQSPCH